jgi:TPR repeat protein
LASRPRVNLWVHGLDDAVAAVKDGDYSTAIKLNRPLAEQGNAEAQFELGHLYDHG